MNALAHRVGSALSILRRRPPLTIFLAVLAALTAGGGRGPLAAPVAPAIPDPQIIAHLGGWSTAVDVEGRLAYVAVGSRVRVVDVTDPAHPRTLSESPELPAPIDELSVTGGMVYVADRAFGLRIVDARDPLRPQVVGAGEKVKGAKAVQVAGGHAYLADGAAGVHVLDVADPRQVREVAVIPVGGGEAWDLDIVGDRAYIADRIGLRAVDVSQPAAPALIGSRDSAGWARDVAVSGTHAFVADGDRGLTVLDLTDPTDISRVANLDTAGEAWAVELAGTRAYVADGTGLGVFDISDPELPVALGALALPGEARDLDLAGNTVFVAAGSAGLRIIDVSDPAAPRELAAMVDLPVQANAAAAAAGRLYVADSAYGLRVFDLTRPAAPAALGGLDTAGTPLEVRQAGGQVYLADREGGLLAIDARDPAKPLAAGKVDLAPRRVTDLDIDGQLAAVLDAPADGGRQGLRLFDLANPAAPRPLGALSSLRLAYDLQLSAGRAYVADLDGLRVFDVRDPAAPVELGKADTIGVVYGVAVAGSTVFASIGESGLRVLDASDPEHRRVIGAADTDGYFRDLQWVDGLLYVADKDFGLRVFDVREPSAPREVAARAVTGPVEHVLVDGNFAYLSLGTTGLAVLSLSDAPPTATPEPTPPPTPKPSRWRIGLPWLASGR